MNSDYPKISGLHFDERSGVYRRFHVGGRMELRCYLSSSSSSPSANQFTGTASGQAQQAQGNRNAIGNTTTTVKNSAANSNNSTANSGNKVSVGNGGTLSYVTNTAGFSAADVVNLFKNIGGGSSDGTGLAGGGGVSVFTTPNAALSTASTSSTVKWAIIAAVATVIGVLWTIFRKKS